MQEECYTSLDICTVARTNPDAIGEVVQVPTHFPNRSGPMQHMSLLTGRIHDNNMTYREALIGQEQSVTDPESDTASQMRVNGSKMLL